MSPTRQLAAIMFTDIVGYTALMGKDEVKAFQLLEKNRQIQKPIIEHYNGRWIKELGDGALVQFQSAYDAVKCAHEIQLAAARDLGALLRIGIHLGDITVEDGDVFGDGVNVASRIQGIADPGGIYISESIEKAVRNRSDIMTKSLGRANLKNVDYPVSVFAIQGDGLPAPRYTRTKGLKRKQTLLAFLPLVLLLAVASWFIVKNIGFAKSAKVRSIAVLPILNLTGSAENSYLVDGLHDALITELSLIGSLRVTSRTSARAYANANKPVKDIARELNVDAVIESSMLRTDDTIRLNVQVIKITSQEDHLYTGVFIQNVEQVLAMISNVTREISGKIKVALSADDNELINRKKDIDPELHRLYMRGKFHLLEYTPDGFQKGINYLNEVIAKDPAWAPAYATLSIGYGDLAHLPSAPIEAFPRAKALAKRALEIDPSLTEANTAMAEVNLYFDWHIKSSEKYFKAALNTDSSYAPAVSNYGWYLDLIGQYKAAEYYLRKAADLDPLAPVYRAWLAWWYWSQKRYNEGVAEAKKVLEYSPQFPVAKYVLGGIYADMGRFEEAITLSKEAADKRPNLINGLGIAYIKAGKMAEATQLLHDIEKTPFNSFSLALIYAALGNITEAVAWLNVVKETKHMFTPWISSGFFAPEIADDPRVKNLLKPIADSIQAAKK